MKTVQEHKNVQCTMNNVQWRKVRLGEVCVPSSEKYNPLTENIFQYCIEMENINQESGTINGKSDITKLLSLKTKFHRGEVLYGKLRPYLKKYWLADFDGACSTEIWVLKNSENIDNQFLYYLFQSDCINRIANQSSGTKMPRADWKFMEKQTVSIPFKNGKPDLSTQRRIAAILSSADKVIDSTRRLIEKYKKMKQGMMEELFNEQCTMNNVQWRKVRLGKVCEPSSEKYNPLTENTFQYCIEMENINQESGTINGKSDITKLLSLKTKFHKGEVLYGKLRPYLKKYWLADFDGACSTEIWVLKNMENIDNQFLFYLFQSDCINRIANQSSGTKMPRADWIFMEKQTVCIPYKNNKPDLAEQRRIAATLSGIDAKIAAEEKVLEKYEKVKKGLMERLLEEKR